MPKSSPYLQRSLVLDSGHSLVQVPKRNGILWKRIAPKEFGITSRKRCWWNSLWVDVQGDGSPRHVHNRRQQARKGPESACVRSPFLSRVAHARSEGWMNYLPWVPSSRRSKNLLWVAKEGHARIWPKPHLANFGVLMFLAKFSVVACCSWLLLVVVCWCLLVPVGACWWCLLVLVGACWWCLLVPVGGACWCLLVPVGGVFMGKNCQNNYHSPVNTNRSHIETKVRHIYEISRWDLRIGWENHSWK